MSNPDRVVKVGQTWKFYGQMPRRMVRGIVVTVEMAGPCAPMYGFADLREKNGGILRMFLDKDGTCLGDDWVRVSHPKPKGEPPSWVASFRDKCCAEERERIAKAMQVRAQQTRESALHFAPQTVAYVAVLHAAMFTETWAKWIREGAK